METFDCNLCKKKFERQFEFFSHLKDHYEEDATDAKVSGKKSDGELSSPALVDRKTSADNDGNNDNNNDDDDNLDVNDSNVDIANKCATKKKSAADLSTVETISTVAEPVATNTEQIVPKKSGRGRKRNVEVQSAATVAKAVTSTTTATTTVAAALQNEATAPAEIDEVIEKCKQEIIDDGSTDANEVSTGETTSMPRRSRRKPVKAAIRNIKREFLLTEDEFDFIDRDSEDDDQRKVKVQPAPGTSEIAADETIVEAMDDEEVIDNDDPDFDPITDASVDNIVYEEIEESKDDSLLDLNGGTRKKRASKTKAPTVMENNKLFYKCNECDRKFGHRSSYDYHRRWHAGDKKFICQYCNKAFLSSTLLKVHTRIHTDERPFACKMCDKAFRQWSDLKYHFDSLHSNEKNYQCEFCGKGFARNYSLIIHRRIHTGEKNYKCEVCGKSFRASCYLLMHRMIHTGEKRYSCDICQKRFRLNSDMKRHRETHSANRKRGSKKKMATIVAEDTIEQQLNNAETDEMIVFEENEETIFKIERYVPGDNSDDGEDSQNTFVVTPLVVKVVNPN